MTAIRLAFYLDFEKWPRSNHQLADHKQMLFTARTYLDKYGPNDRYDDFVGLPRVRVPLLLTLGSFEDYVIFQPLTVRGPALHDDLPHVAFATVDGADHFYTTRTTELSATVRRWLDDVATPTPV
jgi:hypothetical protein